MESNTIHVKVSCKFCGRSSTDTNAIATHMEICRKTHMIDPLGGRSAERASGISTDVEYVARILQLISMDSFETTVT